MFIGILTIIIIYFHGLKVNTYEWSELKLPQEHIPFFFKNNQDLQILCENDETCSLKVIIVNLIKQT